MTLAPSDKPNPKQPANPAAQLGLTPGTDLWVFGYGSLMWHPGFAFIEQQPALLEGYHRKFCIASTHYRGTPEQPGLVLGLDVGGSCQGLAFRVAAANVAQTLDYLWRRELITNVYRPLMLPIRLASQMAEACTFVADQEHEEYRGGLCHDEAAAFIRSGCGCNGPNIDYLMNTVHRLDELGIPDAELRTLLAAAKAGDIAQSAAMQGMAGKSES